MRLFGGRPLTHHFLGPPPGRFGQLQVDLLGWLGDIGQDHDLIRPDLDDPAIDGKRIFARADFDT